jgi:hypothetical protein
MQTIQLQIEDSKVDIFLNLIQNLKDGIIKSYTLSNNMDENLELDPYFYERQQELNHLLNNVESGNMKMYDFNNSMDELLEELQA